MASAGAADHRHRTQQVVADHIASTQLAVASSKYAKSRLAGIVTGRISARMIPPVAPPYPKWELNRWGAYQHRAVLVNGWPPRLVELGDGPSWQPANSRTCARVASYLYRQAASLADIGRWPHGRAIASPNAQVDTALMKGVHLSIIRVIFSRTIIFRGMAGFNAGGAAVLCRDQVAPADALTVRGTPPASAPDGDLTNTRWAMFGARVAAGGATLADGLDILTSRCVAREKVDVAVDSAWTPWVIPRRRSASMRPAPPGEWPVGTPGHFEVVLISGCRW